MNLPRLGASSFCRKFIIAVRSAFSFCLARLKAKNVHFELFMKPRLQ